MVPASGSWSVARMRMSVDLPAPFGPSRPYIPAGMVSVTPFSACTPLGYVLETPRMSSCMVGFGRSDTASLTEREARLRSRRRGGDVDEGEGAERRAETDWREHRLRARFRSAKYFVKQSKAAGHEQSSDCAQTVAWRRSPSCR